MTINTVTLNTGVVMPAMGFGVFQTPPEATADAVAEALRVGYRLIDTAAAYGNERGVGEGIRASGLGRTPAQVVLRWHVQQGVIVFPKTSRPERMTENIDVFDFELSAEEMRSIAALDEQRGLGIDLFTYVG